MARIKSGFTGRTGVAALAAMLALACGGGDDPPTGNTGTIQVGVNPATLTLEQGGTGTVTVTLTRGGGFDGAVTLAVSGLPAGVTTTVTPAQLTGATTSASVAVAVAATVAPGTYTATVTGTAQGIGAATTTYQLTVTALPTYALSLTPAALTIEQGGSSNATVNITRTNFTGAVALTLLNPPAGITGTFTPASSTTNSSALVVAVAGTAATGNHTLTIQGTGTGPGVKTTQLALTVTAPAAPGYALTATPATLSVVQGQAGTVDIAIARTNFTAAVNLAYENPVTGITGTLTPSSTTGNTSVFAFNVAANVTPGVHTLNLRGTATGLTDRTASVQVTVTAAPGSIALAATPTAISVQQGQSGNVNLALTRNNFAGAVTFAATGAPTGVTPTFNPNGTTTSASVMSLAVAANAPAGVHQITVTASGTGVTNATAQVALTITTPGSGGSSRYQFCSASETPIFFAVQDGTGPWQRVTGTTTGSTTEFAFSITQNRGGVMYVFQRTSAIVADGSAVGRTSNRLQMARRLVSQSRTIRSASTRGQRARTFGRSSFVDFYETQVVFGSAAELTQLGTDNCAVSLPGKTITGTVAGVGAGQSALLSLGSSFQPFIGGFSTNPVTFEDVPSGTIDFVGTRSPQAFGAPDKVVLFRNLNIADGGALPSTIDFNGPASSVPASATATITNGANDELTLTSQLTTANGQTMFFYFDVAGTGTTRSWSGLAPSAMVAGDVHGLFLFASPPGSQTADGRFLFKYVGPVANQTLALGPSLTAPTTTQLAAGTYPRFRFQGTLPAEYRQVVFIDVRGPGATGNSVSLTATAAYLTAAGSASAYDLAMPDVAGLTGFPIASRLAAGTNDVSVTAAGFTGSGILAARPVVGDEMKLATKSATITVP